MHFSTVFSGLLLVSAALAHPGHYKGTTTVKPPPTTSPKPPSTTTPAPPPPTTTPVPPATTPPTTTKPPSTTTKPPSTTPPTTTTKPTKTPSPVCSPLGISAADKKAVVKQFATDQIVPDLIERINPTVKVNVAYGNKAVQLGTYFTTLQTLTMPTLNFSGEAAYDPYRTKYTYFLVDPDVPQDGSLVQVNYLHWMVSHAQPVCVTTQTPETVVSYQSLTPASTTQHRYTFLVYREPAGYEPINDILLQTRTPFDLNDYVQDNNLVLVGGNFLKEAINNGLQG